VRRVAALSVAAALCTLCWVGPAAAEAQRPLSRVVLPSLGPGYSLLSQGPLNATNFTTSAPNPTAAATALGQLSASKAISTFERIWHDANGDNEVQILLVRFRSISPAQDYFLSVQHALKSGEIMSAGALAGVHDAFRTTYFAATSSQVGVGQAITFEAGTTVATLSFFSSNAKNDTHPITLSAARSIAQLQLGAIDSSSATSVGPHRSLNSSSFPYWVVVIIVAAGLGAVTFMVVLLIPERRKKGTYAVPGAESESDAPLTTAALPRSHGFDAAVLLGLLALSLVRRRAKT
jgi:hypothetical protein